MVVKLCAERMTGKPITENSPTVEKSRARAARRRRPIVRPG